MMDDRTAETLRTFLGHNGPVYRCSYSPDKTMMLSCSEDTTVRLWSLHTWTCVVVYRGHQYPIWDVRFSPHGHYFATCSHDKTARLWATDNNQPLRIFVGHYSDVDVRRQLYLIFIVILIVIFFHLVCSISSEFQLHCNWFQRSYRSFVGLCVGKLSSINDWSQSANLFASLLNVWSIFSLRFS